MRATSITYARSLSLATLFLDAPTCENEHTFPPSVRNVGGRAAHLVPGGAAQIRVEVERAVKSGGGLRPCREPIAVAESPRSERRAARVLHTDREAFSRRARRAGGDRRVLDREGDIRRRDDDVLVRQAGVDGDRSPEGGRGHLATARDPGGDA